MLRRSHLVTLAGLISFAFVQAAPAPKDMELFLLVGQSNMAGRGKVEAQDQVENPHIFMLTKDLQWVPAKDPVHFDKSAAGVGLCSEFAREVLKAKPGTTIGLIPCAVGGTSLDQWKAGGKLYQNAVARAKEAMKNGKLAGILWHQGESDSGKPELIASYPDRLAAMVEQLRKDLGAEKTPFVMGELIHGHGNHDAANVGLAKAAAKVPNCTLVSSKDLGKGLHFDSPALRAFGKRYAEAYLKMVSGR
jgi:Carbohydrate esterase, sialic acid-specific acetylesterase